MCCLVRGQTARLAVIMLVGVKGLVLELHPGNVCFIHKLLRRLRYAARVLRGIPARLTWTMCTGSCVLWFCWLLVLPNTHVRAARLTTTCA
jgi:hypothetical protein